MSYQTSVGKRVKAVLVIDNAPWHNRLTEDTMPPKRSWRKELIVGWLRRQNVPVPIKATKAELLELAFDNLPAKRYVVDEVAAKHNIDILRSVVSIRKISRFDLSIHSLPVKHCMFNPIELAWAGLKDYVRDNNTGFRLSDVRRLAQQWMTLLDAPTAAAYVDHTRNIEETYKNSDRFTEQIEEEIIDDDEEVDSGAEETPT